MIVQADLAESNKFPLFPGFGIFQKILQRRERNVLVGISVTILGVDPDRGIHPRVTRRLLQHRVGIFKICPHVKNVCDGIGANRPKQCLGAALIFTIKSFVKVVRVRIENTGESRIKTHF